MNKERAASYLASGCSVGQVASIMGCSPGYIVQLQREDDFKLLVEKARAQNDGSLEAEQESIQSKYTGLEHQLIKAMADALPNAELPAITRALEVVATRQEKAAVRRLPAGHPANGRTGNGVQVTVQLMLPGHAIPAQPVIEYNAKNEVVAIDNKPMAPMSSSGVERMFKERKLAIVQEKVDAFLQQKQLEEVLKEI